MRDQYKEFFRTTGQELPGSSYRIFPDPVPVTITGSIFFDVDHKIGEVHSRNAASGIGLGGAPCQRHRVWLAWRAVSVESPEPRARFLPQQKGDILNIDSRPRQMA